MTWTSAFGSACGWLLNCIVHGLSLLRISAKCTDFHWRAHQFYAAYLFGHANVTNSGRMFFYAGLGDHWRRPL